MTLPQLEWETGIAHATWRKLCQNRRVKASKLGRDWVIQWSDAVAYLDSRSAAGRPAARPEGRRRRIKPASD